MLDGVARLEALGVDSVRCGVAVVLAAAPPHALDASPTAIATMTARAPAAARDSGIMAGV
jgi:hypothetical protein